MDVSFFSKISGAFANVFMSTCRVATSPVASLQSLVSRIVEGAALSQIAAHYNATNPLIRMESRELIKCYHKAKALLDTTDLTCEELGSRLVPLYADSKSYEVAGLILAWLQKQYQWVSLYENSVESEHFNNASIWKNSSFGPATKMQMTMWDDMVSRVENFNITRLILRSCFDHQPLTKEDIEARHIMKEIKSEAKYLAESLLRWKVQMDSGSNEHLVIFSSGCLNNILAGGVVNFAALAEEVKDNIDKLLQERRDLPTVDKIAAQKIIQETAEVTQGITL